MYQKIKVLKIPFEFSSSFLRGSSLASELLWEYFSKKYKAFSPKFSLEVDDIIQHIQVITVEEEGWFSNKVALDKIITNLRKMIHSEREFVLTVGGEHTTTLIPVTLLSSVYNQFSVVQFDAHGDLRDKFEGDRLSHATVIRRITQDLKHKVISVGIRSISKEEIEYIDENRGSLFLLSLEEIFKKRGSLKKIIFSHLKEITNDNLYLSIDFDFFSPWILPSVTTPEPGLPQYDSFYLFTEILDTIFSSKRVIGADLVEFKPDTSFEGVYSLHFASSVVFELLSRVVYYYF